ncbi:MAG: orotidine-5'-phosphate decarboxylase [Bacteriovoracaceae bacterium]|nr:orotidine-5'-phosphate decarboxylase [Bacteriovoracaceae bacterium]
MSMEKVFAALDNMTKDQVIEFVASSNGDIKNIKVGMELFYAEGPELLHELSSKFGVKIFLDLKLHDIPNTVAKAIRSLKGLPVHFLTIHTSGGQNMIESAMSAVKEHLPSAKVLGVSYLTSLSPKDLKDLWDINEEHIPKAFERFFNLGIDSGIDGFILSPLELDILKEVEINKNVKVLKVTPGIRFQDEIESGKTQDQKRVLNPSDALKAGADYLVMGRSLSQSENLKERVTQINAIS